MDKLNDIIKLYGQDLRNVRNSLFFFLTAWTAVILIMGWLNFFIPAMVVPDIAVTSYLILLSVYILHKEVNRWTGIKMGIKPGELVVYIWWTSLLIMVLISFLVGPQVPEGIKFVSFEVLGAFLASEISKSLNSYKIKGGQQRHK